MSFGKQKGILKSKKRANQREVTAIKASHFSCKPPLPRFRRARGHFADGIDDSGGDNDHGGDDIEHDFGGSLSASKRMHPTSRVKASHVNYVSMNKEALWKQASRNATEKQAALVAERKKRKPGYIPRSIIRAKENIAAKNATVFDDAPEMSGPTAMPESERLALIEDLKMKHRETMFEYQRHTHRTTGGGGERRIARIKRLEEDLDYLQEAIKKLAAPVVFVDC